MGGTRAIRCRYVRLTVRDDPAALRIRINNNIFGRHNRALLRQLTRKDGR